uniref:Autophagy-related protein n=1 Tax=viral metagenome TaxID=1070528 RepID=A0A6C0E541_9ZZZZ
MLFNYKKTFQETHALNERITESNRIRAKYPTHIPVIINCDSKLGSINKQKFLVPSDVSASHLLYSVRKQMSDYKSSQSIFMFCNNAIICPTTLMCEIYNKYLKNKKEQDDDLFLYIDLCSENTFG